MVVSSMEFDLEMRKGSIEPTVLVMGMGITGVSCARHLPRVASPPRSLIPATARPAWTGSST